MFPTESGRDVLVPLTLSGGLSIYGERNNGAGIAQLVEPYLAKVAVASSSLVSRSTFFVVRVNGGL